MIFTAHICRALFFLAKFKFLSLVSSQRIQSIPPVCFNSQDINNVTLVHRLEMICIHPYKNIIYIFVKRENKL